MNNIDKKLQLNLKNAFSPRPLNDYKTILSPVHDVNKSYDFRKNF
jgi:hypothetical protein